MTPQAALNPGIGGVRLLDERDRLLEVQRVMNSRTRSKHKFKFLSGNYVPTGPRRLNGCKNGAILNHFWLSISLIFITLFKIQIRLLEQDRQIQEQQSQLEELHRQRQIDAQELERLQRRLDELERLFNRQ